MRTSSISVVLPIYRTAQYLNELYDRLVAALEPCCGQFEIIMVDDGSPDGAWRIISELAANDPRIKGIRLSRNFGQHPAINAGFDVTNGDVVVLMDADLQDRPEDIPLLLEQLTDDKDIVFTIKREEGVPFSTRLTSHIYHGLFSRITGASVPKNVGTLRLFTRRFLDAVLSYPERNVLFGPLMFHVGFEHSVVEVHRPARMAGGSSYSFRKRLALAVNSLVSYTDLPHRFLMWLGATVLGGAVIYSVLLVVRRFLVAEAIPSGLTLLSLLITISLGATMLAIGIIGMYVFRVYQEVLCRPRYVIARQVNLSK